MRAGTKIISIEHLQALLTKYKNVNRVAAELGITVHGVYYHMAKHKLRAHNMRWTKEHDNYIIFNAYHKSLRAMARYLGCTMCALRNRMIKLGVTMRDSIGYTNSDLARDCGMLAQDTRQWWQVRDLPVTYRHKHVYIAEDDLQRWLAKGNVFRVQDISKAASYIQDIYRECEQQMIRIDEINQICKLRADQVQYLPAPLIRIDTGYVYNRTAFSEWLALNSHLIYAYAKGPYIDSIRQLALERYVTSAQLYAYDERIMYKWWRKHKADYPAPLRTRPNVYDRAELLAWLRERSTHRIWGPLYDYVRRLV